MLPNSKLLETKSVFNDELLQQKHIWGRSLACSLRLCLWNLSFGRKVLRISRKKVDESGALAWCGCLPNTDVKASLLMGIVDELHWCALPEPLSF